MKRAAKQPHLPGDNQLKNEAGCSRHNKAEGERRTNGHGYQGAPVNLTRGYPNLAQLTTTEQFYSQYALPAPNLTNSDAKLAQLCTTLR